MKKFVFCAGLLCLFNLSAFVNAEASPKKKSINKNNELLECNANGSVGLIFGSTRKISCQFHKSDGTVETYAGSIDKFGLDVGITRKSRMVWTVRQVEPARFGSHSLDGEYQGLSAETAIGIGLGANVLRGGTKRNFVLQPVSFETTDGLNLAVGVARLKLISADRKYRAASH